MLSRIRALLEYYLKLRMFSLGIIVLCFILVFGYPRINLLLPLIFFCGTRCNNKRQSEAKMKRLVCIAQSTFLSEPLVRR